MHSTAWKASTRSARTSPATGADLPFGVEGDRDLCTDLSKRFELPVLDSQSGHLRRADLIGYQPDSLGVTLSGLAHRTDRGLLVGRGITVVAVDHPLGRARSSGPYEMQTDEVVGTPPFGEARTRLRSAADRDRHGQHRQHLSDAHQLRSPDSVVEPVWRLVDSVNAAGGREVACTSGMAPAHPPAHGDERSVAGSCCPTADPHCNCHPRWRPRSLAGAGHPGMRLPVGDRPPCTPGWIGST